MPQITQISPQRRRPDRYSIYIDGRYALALGQTALSDAGLRVGDTLTPEALEGLQTTAELRQALDRAYRFIGLRPRSCQEVSTYLRGKAYTPELIATAIADLAEAGLLDDLQFATTWVEERLQFNPRSRQQLQAELRQKGIAREVIDQALAAVGDTTDVTAIQTLIVTKHLQQRYPERQALIRYLATKGFRYDAITTALAAVDISAE